MDPQGRLRKNGPNNLRFQGMFQGRKNTGKSFRQLCSRRGEHQVDEEGGLGVRGGSVRLGAAGWGLHRESIARLRFHQCGGFQNHGWAVEARLLADSVSEGSKGSCRPSANQRQSEQNHQVVLARLGLSVSSKKSQSRTKGRPLVSKCPKVGVDGTRGKGQACRIARKPLGRRGKLLKRRQKAP